MCLRFCSGAQNSRVSFIGIGIGSVSMHSIHFPVLNCDDDMVLVMLDSSNPIREWATNLGYGICSCVAFG